MDKKVYLERLPKKRMGAGALIRNVGGEVLMLRPSCKPILDIPGGVVELNESPRAACRRELREELGMEIALGDLLCVDYQAAKDDYSESLMFVFDGGVLSAAEEAAIHVDGQEIIGFSFLSLSEIKEKTTGGLYRRIQKPLEALKQRRTLYLEDQEEL